MRRNTLRCHEKENRTKAAVQDALTQWQYGNDKIATYDLNGKHWITELDNGRVHIVVSNEDGSHSQQRLHSLWQTLLNTL